MPDLSFCSAYDAKSQLSQLIFVWLFMRAVNLLSDWISLYKAPKLQNLTTMSTWSLKHSNTWCHSCLQSDWCAKILVHGWMDPKRYTQTFPTHVYYERIKRCGESGLASRPCENLYSNQWLTSVINVHRRNFSWQCSNPHNTKNFQPQKMLGYAVCH